MGKFGNKVVTFIKNNDTNILTGIGIADGLIVGGFLWYKTGQKIERVLSKCDKNAPLKEKVKKTWKIFLLPVANTAISGGLLIYSAKIGNKRLAALGAAYNITEMAFQQYVDKTKEELSSKKVEKIAQEVEKQKIDSDGKVIISSKENQITFYEPLTDRYFESTWADIQKAANELNANALTSYDQRITLTEWFDMLGIPKTEISDYMGWDATEDGKNGIIDISIDAILNSDNVPCGAIRYNTRPKYFK